MSLHKICLICNSEITGNFCSNCGQPAEVERITLKYLLSRSLDAFELRDGLLFTIKELSIRPGKAINNYINEQRFKYYNPLKYFLLFGAVFFFLNLKLDIFDFERFIPADSTEKQTLLIEQFISFFFQYFNFVILTVVPFFSLFSYLFFKKKEFNLAENIILNTYLFGHHAFIDIILLPILFFLNLDAPLLIQIYTIVGLVYHTWAYIQFFRVSAIAGILKTFFSFIFGFFCWFIIFTVFVMLYAKIFL